MKISKKIALIAIAAIAAAGLSGCQQNTKTVSCKDLFSPQFHGLSGSARLESYSRVTSETMENFEKDFIGEVNTDTLNDAQKSEYRSAKSTVDSFLNSVNFHIEEVSDSDGYANGDQIQVTAEFTDSYAKLMGLDVTDTTFTYSVEGLHEGTKVNPFDNLKVTFSGISSDGEIEIDKSNCDEFVKNNVRFYASESYDLKNGDTVTVTAEYSSYTAENEEIIITETSKDYTVSGLSEYPDSLDGVDLSALNTKMDEEFKELFDSKYAKGKTAYTDDYAEIKIDSSEYKVVKKYFRNTVVDSNSYYSTPSNSYIVVYEVTATGKAEYGGSKIKKGQTGTITKYMYAYTGTVTLDKDKKIVFDENSIYTDGYYTYNSLDDLYEGISGSSYDKYTITEVK